MKNLNLKSLLAMVCVLNALLSCHKANNAFNMDAERPLVEKAIRDSFGWAKTKDINLLYNVIANNWIIVQMHFSFAGN
jgi:hypothetical protein